MVTKTSSKKKTTKKKGKVKLTALRAQEDEERDFLEPDEWYLGEFEDCEQDEGQYGPYLRFKFRILNGQTESGKSAKGENITTILDATLSPSKKLWSWLKVMLKKEPKVGEDFDITSFYGERYRILVKDKKKKKGDDSGNRFQFIDTIKKRRKPE